MIGKVQSNINFKRIYLEKPTESGRSDTADEFKKLQDIYDKTIGKDSAGRDNKLASCLAEGMDQLDRITYTTGKDYYLIYRSYEYDSDGDEHPAHDMTVVDSNGKVIAQKTSYWSFFGTSWLDTLKNTFNYVADSMKKNLPAPKTNSVDEIIERYSE